MGLLASKLREKIGTDQWKIPLESTLLPKISTPAPPPAGDLCDIHSIPAVINDLNEIRNRYALRITKGSAKRLLEHKNAAALIAWLEIKPLFVSGVIRNDHGKYPFRKVADFLQLSEKTVRRYSSVWRKLKLASFRNKDLILGSYDRLNKILKTECRRKHRLLNNGDTKSLVRNIAIHENLLQQTFRRNNKLLALETGKLFDVADTSCIPVGSNEHHLRRCESNSSARRNRKLKKALLKTIDAMLPKWKVVYNEQMNQRAFGMPAFNPYVTLSCAGVAKICGLTSASSGHAISKKLAAYGWISREIQYLKIDRCAAIFEAEFMGIRNDVFGYKYPVKRQARLEKKYFRTLPQMIETRIDAVLF